MPAELIRRYYWGAAQPGGGMAGVGVIQRQFSRGVRHSGAEAPCWAVRELAERGGQARRGLHVVGLRK